MDISSLESQLTGIVDAAAPRTKAEQAVQQSQPAPAPSEQDYVIDQVSDAVARELEIYQSYRDEGREEEYLKKSADSMNLFFGELNLDVKFKIEASERGFIVSVLDENGKVVKTIPSEKVVETRQRIREMIKGIFEDQAS